MFAYRRTEARTAAYRQSFQYVSSGQGERAGCILLEATSRDWRDTAGVGPEGFTRTAVAIAAWRLKGTVMIIANTPLRRSLVKGAHYADFADQLSGDAQLLEVVGHYIVRNPSAREALINRFETHKIKTTRDVAMALENVDEVIALIQYYITMSDNGNDAWHAVNNYVEHLPETSEEVAA
jgi:hypothetical protein